MSNVARVAGQAANTLVKPLDVEDVFSTYLYKGTGADQTITNGIDLAGEGGLVWTKRRAGGSSNYSDNWLVDSERGDSYGLRSNLTNAQFQDSSLGFSSSGYTAPNSIHFTQNATDYASWTWRKAPKFFDIVTYTGDDTRNKQIAHNLGSVPGCIIVKATSAVGNWSTYHRGLTSSEYYLRLNTTAAEVEDGAMFDANPTSTHFVIGSNSNINSPNVTYVAYLWAHNDGDGDFGPDGDADIIKCGSYTGNGSATGPSVNLGFEPQWLLVKRSDAADAWILYDSMRGIVTGGNDSFLMPQSSGAENVISRISLTPTGFSIDSSNSDTNASGGTYIYIAIRRGPLAPPESATDVFAQQFGNNSGSAGGATEFDAGFPVDFATVLFTTGGNSYPRTASRLTTERWLRPYSTGSELTDTYVKFDSNTSWLRNQFSSSYISHMWRRAPNFCDVVAYTGNGTAGRTVSHNLGVVPEMIWVKRRNSTGHWYVYHTGMTGGSDALHSTARLNLTEAGFDTQTWKNYDFTDAHWSMDNGADFNGSGGTYIAYLFASLDGISKVGSYTGNGSVQNIDCGFSSGARFVLIKKSSGTGGWVVMDSERGIVSGDESYLYLNETYGSSLADLIDPYSGGFATGANGTYLNVSGATYIFYAIA